MKSSYRRWLILPTVLAAAVIVVIFIYNPETSTFYPVCPLTEITGFKCATCGGLRAAHYLIHGDIVTAWRFNPLVVMVLCVILIEGVRTWLWGGNKRFRAVIAVSVIVFAVVFTWWRNH